MTTQFIKNELEETTDQITPAIFAQNWQRMKIWSISHAVDDAYQGVVPASIPFFIHAHNYSFSLAGGLILAATVGGSLPQPLFGFLVDRKPLAWLAPLGILIAGTGFGFAAIMPSYWLICLFLLISGTGIAMYHPSAGRGARSAAGNSASAMSLFATGGSVGFFLAPVIVTPLFVAFGLTSAPLLILPAAIISYILWKKHATIPTDHIPRHGVHQRNQWWQFIALAFTEVVRSTIFSGINTFIALFWIQHFMSSKTLGEIALALFLIGGVCGTIIGGKLADTYGIIRTIRIGSLLAVPAIIAICYSPGPIIGLVFVVIAGICVNIPFAVLIKLGQDYLPNRPGTASAVTIGLAMSIGGLCTPILGKIADTHGVNVALHALMIIALSAFLIALPLRAPHINQR